MAEDDNDDIDVDLPDDDENDDAPDEEDEPKKKPAGEVRLSRALKAERANRDKYRREAAELRKQLAEKTGDDKTKTDAARDREADERALARIKPRLVTAEARAELLKAGAKPERAGRLAKLIDLDNIDLDDAGKVDEDSLATEVDRVKEEWPELFVSKDDDEEKTPARRRSRVDGASVGKKPLGKAGSASTAALVKQLTGGR